MIRVGEDRLSMSGQACQTFPSLISLRLLILMMCGREHHRASLSNPLHHFERCRDFFSPTLKVPP